MVSVTATYSPKHLHFSRFFLTKVYRFELKKYKGVTLTSDSKFEEKLTCDLEDDMMNLAIFHQSTRISHLMGFVY